MPSNIKNPAWLADQAVALADEAGLEATVWDEKQLAERGLRRHRSASARPRRPRRGWSGSTTRPPGRAQAHAHVVLVGKGITFDTGGLSIKPGEAMVNMKRDMTGGAVVIAVDGRARRVGCPVRVIGLVPAAENAVGGNALRPGDVIRHYGGRTTEVTNTDAEGRLVLADALAYAVDELDPDVLVDVATLTGGDEGGARPAASAAASPTTTRSPTRSLERGATRRASRCGGCRWPTVYEDKLSSQGRRRRQRRRAGPARSPRRCSSSTSPAACRGRTSTSPRPATRRRTTSSGPRARPASAPGCCSTGSARPTRWPASSR